MVVTPGDSPQVHMCTRSVFSLFFTFAGGDTEGKGENLRVYARFCCVYIIECSFRDSYLHPRCYNPNSPNKVTKQYLDSLDCMSYVISGCGNSPIASVDRIFIPHQSNNLVSSGARRSRRTGAVNWHCSSEP